MIDSADKSAEPADRHRLIREKLEELSKWVRGETPPDDVTMFVDTAEIDLKARRVIRRIAKLIETPLDDARREDLAAQICRLQIEMDDLKSFCGTSVGPLERLHSAFFDDDEEDDDLDSEK